MLCHVIFSLMGTWVKLSSPKELCPQSENLGYYADPFALAETFLIFKNSTNGIWGHCMSGNSEFTPSLPICAPLSLFHLQKRTRDFFNVLNTTLLIHTYFFLAQYLYYIWVHTRITVKVCVCLSCVVGLLLAILARARREVRKGEK